jgi:hypothetical protein
VAPTFAPTPELNKPNPRVPVGFVQPCIIPLLLCPSSNYSYTHGCLTATPTAGPGPIHVPKVSRNPLLNEGPGALPQRRTGDYSAATLDEQGTVWGVAEWASDKYTYLKQPDTGNPRTSNWGTYIMEVNPYTLD